jgi:hypothetical protein
MSANHISPPEMKIKILKEGEEVINLWRSGSFVWGLFGLVLRSREIAF